MALSDLINTKEQERLISQAFGDLIDNSQYKKKIGVSEERVRAVIPALRQYVAFWREYPDLFVDMLQTGGDPTKHKKFNFFFYQRVFLRAAMRYQYVYMVFPRAWTYAPQRFWVNFFNCGNPALVRVVSR